MRSKFARQVALLLAAAFPVGLVSCASLFRLPSHLGSGPPAPGIAADLATSANVPAIFAAERASASFHVADVWGSPMYHGALVIAAGYDYTKAFVGPLSCAACHAGGSPSEPSPNPRAPNCYTCHDGGPDGSAFHPPGWLDPTSTCFHGSVVAAAGYDYTHAMEGNLACVACHAGLTPDQLSPNTRAPNCFTCHAGGPDGSAGHPSDWMDTTSPNFHGRVANVAGFDTTVGMLSCSACHGGYGPNDASVNPRAPSCLECHAGGPDGSPGHPKGWLDPTSKNFHGAVVEAAGFDYTKAIAPPGKLACATCHAGDSPTQVSPNPAAPNCYSCHAGGVDGSPGHPDGWMDPSSSEFHGLVVKAAACDYTKAKAPPGDLTCATCHAGASPTQQSPNPNAPNCYTCHVSGPDVCP